MRLVSALYPYHYPFQTLAQFEDFTVAESPDDIVAGDVLIVWGGSDIHPSLYNKGRSSKSWAGDHVSTRDAKEWALMHRCKELGNNIIGVCRGAQMLCALAGGTLIQHVNNHGSYKHKVKTYDGQEFIVNSIHHQMMNPTNTNHNVVAWASQKLSDVYYDVDNTVEIDQEPEFIHFPDIKGFGIQWHPEGVREDHPSTIYSNTFIASHL